MAMYFFPSSRHAAVQITALFNFVWPTAAALWNLRWQVSGYLAAVPDATAAQLNERFVKGSGLHGTDLKGACVDANWDDQKSRFASLVLSNAFSIYESWADEIAKEFGGSFRGLNLQFPGDVAGIIATLSASSSSVMMAAYYPIYSTQGKYSGSILPNLMLAYRYFKEVRNCEMHAGGLAGDRVLQAYRLFLPFSDKMNLGMRGDLILDEPISGAPLRLHLRGVVGFCDIMLRIIATLDAELGRTANAEKAFKINMANVIGEPVMLGGNLKRRRQQVASRCVKAGYPRPANIDAVYDFLRAEGVIQI